MASSDQKEMGRRVAFFRQQLGLSQKQLGQMIDRSEGWVSQVERGVRKLDRVSVLESLSDALGVSVQAINDTRVAISEAPVSWAEGSLNSTLAASYALQYSLTELEPPDVDKIVSESAQTWGLVSGFQHKSLSSVMDLLIPKLEYATRHVTGDNKRRIDEARAKAYYAITVTLSNMGEMGAAWVAADRGIAAAESAKEPLLMAEGAFHLTSVFQGMRRPDLTVRVAITAARSLEESADLGSIEAISLTGALFLEAAMAEAQRDDVDRAYAYLDIAKDMANRVGEDRNDYHTEFGRNNALAREVSIAVELSDAGRALQAAHLVRPGDLSEDRAVRLHIDTARAWAQRQEFTAAADALRAASKVDTGSITRYPEVAELVTTALRLDVSEPYLHKLGRELDQPDI